MFAGFCRVSKIGLEMELAMGKTAEQAQLGGESWGGSIEKMEVPLYRWMVSFDEKWMNMG